MEKYTVTVHNRFVAMLFDIRLRPGTQRRVKDINRATHITRAWHNKVEQGDTEAAQKLKQLSLLIQNKVAELNALAEEVNQMYECHKDDLPIVKRDKFIVQECSLEIVNPYNIALMEMLEALDKVSTRMTILFWNYKYAKKQEYFLLQKRVATPLRSVLQWLYKQASTH